MHDNALLKGSEVEAESCMRVFTTQMGFVHVEVATPAKAAAPRWTAAFSRPSLSWLAIICFPLPYVKKLILRAGITPTRVGPKPLNKAGTPSFLKMSLKGY